MSRDYLELGMDPPMEEGWGSRIARVVMRGPERADDSFFELNGALGTLDRFRVQLKQRSYAVIVGTYTTISVLVYVGIIYVSVFASLRYSGPSLDGNDNSKADIPIWQVPCGQTDAVWGSHCGLEGQECMGKFGQEETLLVRCPAFCDKGALAFSPMIVQDRKVQYEPFFVLGTDAYRADSFPCAAGMQEGLVGSDWGGVIGLRLRQGFTMGNDVHAFPASFQVFEVDKRYVWGPYWDSRWLCIILHVLVVIVGAFVVESGALYYTLVTAMSFVVVGFSFDPALIVQRSNVSDSGWALVSLVVGRLTFAGFLFKCLWDWVFAYMFEEYHPVARAFFVVSIVPTLCYNGTVDRLPVDRMLWSDISSMKGGIFTMSMLLLTLVVGTCIQAYTVWRAGWFTMALVRYVFGILVLTLISFIPHLNLRLHHWVIGILLLPGCKTRSQLTSYIFAGLLLGLVINGLSRWGFASIVESSTVIIRDKHTMPAEITNIELAEGVVKAVGLETGNGVRWWFNDVLIAMDTLSVKMPYDMGFLRVSKGTSRYLVARVLNGAIQTVTEL